MSKLDTTPTPLFVTGCLMANASGAATAAGSLWYAAQGVPLPVCLIAAAAGALVSLTAVLTQMAMGGDIWVA